MGILTVIIITEILNISAINREIKYLCNDLSYEKKIC